MPTETACTSGGKFAERHFVSYLTFRRTACQTFGLEVFQATARCYRPYRLVLRHHVFTVRKVLARQWSHPWARRITGKVLLNDIHTPHNRILRRIGQQATLVRPRAVPVIDDNKYNRIWKEIIIRT